MDRRRALQVLCLGLVAAALILAARTSRRDPPREGLSGPAADEEPAHTTSRTLVPDAAPLAATSERDPALREAAAVSDPLATGGVTVIGRVADDRRRPVAGATVILIVGSARPVETRSSDHGAFTARVPAAAEQTLVVRAIHEGRAALENRPLEPDPLGVVDAGTVIVAPSRTLRVHVTEDKEPAAVAEVTLFYPASESASPLARAVTDATGRVTFPDYTGPYWIRAVSRDRRATGTTSPWVTPEAAEIELPLAKARDVDIQVRESGTGHPIAGARVRALEVGVVAARVSPPEDAPTPLVTDKDGHALLTGVHEHWTARIDVTAAGYHCDSTTSGGRVTVNGDARTADVFLMPLQRAAWPIVAGERPVPAEGTPVRIESRPGAPALLATADHAGRIEGATLIVDRLFTDKGDAIAFLPDGSVAALRMDRVRDLGDPISFRRPRSVEVSLHEPDGTPVPGWRVELRRADRPESGQPADSLVAPATATDPDGTARFGGLYGGRAVILAMENGWGWPETSAGVADLDRGDAKVAFTVEPAVIVVARVGVDGERRLPTQYALGLSGASRGRIEENADRAELRFSARPRERGKPFVVNLHSGFRVASASVDPGPPGAETHVDLDLSAGAAIRLRLRKPAGRDASVELQAWSDTAAGWTGAIAQTEERRPIPADGTRETTYHVVRTGRYRFRESVSGLTTGTIDVPGPSGTYDVFLDLSQSGLITGTLRVPEGEDVRPARVRVSGDGLERDWRDDFGDCPGVTVEPNGRFTAIVPLDRPVTLRAWHPCLVPARPGGEITLTGPAEDVTLTLELGNSAVFRVATLPAPSAVRLFRGEGLRDAASTHRVQWFRGAQRFNGFEPGTYTLWFDHLRAPPLAIPDVTLRAGTTDLGELSFAPGAALRIEFVTEPGLAAPEAFATATSETEPRYSRFGISRGEQDLLIQGLGPGRFDVVVRSGRGRSRTFTVDADGRSEQRLACDLR